MSFLAFSSGGTRERSGTAANTDEPTSGLFAEKALVEWLLRGRKPAGGHGGEAPPALAAESSADDGSAVANLCGYGAREFASAGGALPLTAAEIDCFRRNHRDTERFTGRDFLAVRSEMPSPLGELWGLYRHRARVDAEAALFVTQATGTSRVARVMADLLAIGGFANALENVTQGAESYAISAAFDTSDIIDRAVQEATRRQALPIGHPAHLLILPPDEVALLAAHIAERHALPGEAFLEKARLLAEARQDVGRLPVRDHFATALREGDLWASRPWAARLHAAYTRLLPHWGTSATDAPPLLRSADILRAR